MILNCKYSNAQIHVVIVSVNSKLVEQPVKLRVYEIRVIVDSHTRYM